MVRWDVDHGVAVVGETSNALPVHQDLGGHPAQLEEVHLLPEALQNRMPGIWKSHERKAMLRPEVGEGVSPLRPDHDDLGVPPRELLIPLAQLRHVPLAKGSREAAVEDQHHVSLPAEVRKTHPSPGEILEVEVRS